MMTLMEDKEEPTAMIGNSETYYRKFSDISMARRHKDVYEKIVARYRQ